MSDLVERLRGLQAAWDAHVAGVESYNARLKQQREAEVFPPRMGDLYRRMSDATSEWHKAAQEFAADRVGENSADEIEQLRRELAADDKYHAGYLAGTKVLEANRRLRIAAEAEVAKLREALEFYATAGDDGQWEYGEWVTKLTQDGGSRARDTLRRAAALAQQEGQADA